MEFEPVGTSEELAFLLFLLYKNGIFKTFEKLS